MTSGTSGAVDVSVFRLVLESLSDTVLLTDEVGDITWVCPNVHVIFDRTDSEVLGLGRISELLGNEALSSAELRDGRTVVNRRVTTRRPDDTERVLLASVKPISCEAGSRLWAFRDVTDLSWHVERENALEHAERKARGRYRRTPAMLHSIDADGRLVEVSDRWLEVLGYRRDEVLGRRSVEFLPEAERVVAERDYLPRFFREGRLDNVPSRMVAADGSVRDVTLSAVAEHDDDGRFLRSLAAITDVTDQLRLERERQQIEHRFRQIVETVDEGVMVIDHGEVLYANPQAPTILGWSQHEFRSRGPADFIHPDDIDRVMGIHRRRMAGGDAPSSYEYRVVGEDGRTRWIEMNATRITWDDREAALGAFRDVTERRSALEALRASEARSADSQAIAHVGSYEFSIRSPEVHWSDETFRIVGRNADAGPPGVVEFYDTYVHPDDRGWVQEQIDRAISEDQGIDIEYRVLRHDGEIRHVHSIAAPVAGADGAVERYLGAIHDITDFVLSERALAASEERFRRIYEASPLGIGLVDPQNQRIVDANPALCRLLGYPVDELKHRTVDDITHPDDRAAEHELIADVLSGASRSYAMEKRYVRKDSTVRWVRVFSTVIRGVEPEPPTLGLALVADITERRQSQQRLRASERRLQGLAIELTIAEERERRRLAQALHDGLAQDLAFAMLRSGAVAAGLERDSELHQVTLELRSLLERCVAEARSMTVELSPPVLDELGLVAAIEWLAEAILAPRGITVDLVLAEPPGPLREEIAILLFHAARELLTNVVKHADADHVTIELAPDNGGLRLSVEDDGVGLKGGPAAPTSSFGLYSLGERLKALGGRMAIRSGPKGGLRISLELPAAAVETS